MKSFKSILLTFIIAGTANAADTTTTKFISLDACKTYYASSVTAVSGQTADTYCADKIMTLVEACTATKISEYVTANKLTAITDLTNTEQMNLKSKFSYQCQVTAQSEAASAAQKAAATQVTSSSSTATTTAVAVAGTAAAVAAASNSGIANVKTATQIAQQGVKLTESIEKVQSAAAQKAAANSASGNKDGGSSAGTSQGVTPPAARSEESSLATREGSASSKDSSAFSNSSKQETAGENPYSLLPNAKLGGATNNGSVASTSEHSTIAIAKGADARAELGSAGAEATTVSPTLAPQVNGIQSASQIEAGASALSKTEISTTANARNATLLSQTQAEIQAAFALSAPAALTQTAAALQTLNGQIQKYINTTKVACINSAENASFLCVEGTSPGAIAAKQLMSAAGPILAIVSSAQKTCSSTAKVTRVVNLGLTVAAGVCVGAKAMCDSSCATAAADLKTILAAIVKLQGTLSTEAVGLSHPCIVSMNSAPYCISLEKNFPVINSKLAALTSILNPEASLAPVGTTGSIMAKCTGYAKDVARFAVQVLGTYAAQQNAQKCADQLASSGTAAANITTQQYCEKSENVSSQLCICQKNSMASGCPGAVVASTNTSTTAATDQAGTNIKALGGNAAFAGGFGSGAKGTSLGSGHSGLGTDGAGLGGGGASGALAGGAAGASGSGAGVGSGGGAVAGGGSGLGGVPASELAADVAAKKDGEEKKKWGFGAFSGGLGGLFGGSGGSSASGSNGKSGALSTKDQSAIQRQIASEKISAEVSGASGKSNWEKIRNMYILKESSFILGQ